MSSAEPTLKGGFHLPMNTPRGVCVINIRDRTHSLFSKSISQELCYMSDAVLSPR